MSALATGDVHSREFWDGLERGELRVPRCGACKRVFFPPLSSCPNCGGTEVAYVTASGRGRAYSWVTVHLAFDPAFAEDVPYTVVTMTLEEDPAARVVGLLVEGAVQQLGEGVAVEVVPCVRPQGTVPGVRITGSAPAPLSDPPSTPL